MRHVALVALAICSSSLTACSSPAGSVAEARRESSKEPGGANGSMVHDQHSGSDSARSSDGSHVGESRHKLGQPTNQTPTKHAGHADHNESASQDHNRHLPGTPSTPPTDGGISIAIGDQVPDFEVMMAGKKLKLSELRQDDEVAGDGAIVLTFWCSFCHSCRHVEKSLDELARKYRGRAAVIALDASAGESFEQVAKVAKENGLGLPIALDGSGRSADIFGTRVTTTTVVIDRHGVLRYRGQFGDRQHAFAENALKAVLAGQSVKVSETRQKG